MSLLFILVLCFSTIQAWPVSNRTACFKYIDCLEQAQFAFKKCSQGTVVALTLETRDKLFHTSAATQWSVVSKCQTEMELEGLDFDSLQALINEDSRECFRSMHKRRVPLQTVCDVPNFPIVPTIPQSPKTCLINFREDRKSCEQMLNCCPEHIKCAERLNTLSIAYQEAKKKSVAIADKMLVCVYQSLGLSPPKKSPGNQGDFLRKHRGANIQYNNAKRMNSQDIQSTVRFIRKERPRKNERPIPISTDKSNLHAYARVKTSAYKMGKVQTLRSVANDYAFGPQKTETVKEAVNKGNKYADKLIANNVEFQIENQGVYSFGPKTTVTPKEEETTPVPEKTTPVSEKTTPVPVGVSEIKPSLNPRKDLEVESPRQGKDPFETYDDGTKLDEEATGDPLLSSTTTTTVNTTMETTTTIQPTITISLETVEPTKAGFEAIPVMENNTKEKLEKMMEPSSAESSSPKPTELVNESENYKQRTELVKYLLASADSFESQLYLQLAAENKYDELERIAAEKRKIASSNTGIENTGRRY